MRKEDRNCLIDCHLGNLAKQGNLYYFPEDHSWVTNEEARYRIGQKVDLWWEKTLALKEIVDAQYIREQAQLFAIREKQADEEENSRKNLIQQRKEAKERRRLEAERKRRLHSLRPLASERVKRKLVFRKPKPPEAEVLPYPVTPLEKLAMWAENTDTRAEYEVMPLLHSYGEKWLRNLLTL